MDKTINSVINKSNILMHYWIRHNNDHIEHYKGWLKKLEDAGYNDITEDIKKVIQYSEEMNKCIESAIKKLQLH